MQGQIIQQTRRQVLGSIGAVAIGTAGCLDQGPPEYDAAEFLEGDEELADHRGERIIVHGDIEYTGNVVRGDGERTGDDVYVQQEDGSFERPSGVYRIYSADTAAEDEYIQLVDGQMELEPPQGVDDVPVIVEEYFLEDDPDTARLGFFYSPHG